MATKKLAEDTAPLIETASKSAPLPEIPPLEVAARELRLVESVALKAAEALAKANAEFIVTRTACRVAVLEGAPRAKVESTTSYLGKYAELLRCKQEAIAAVDDLLNDAGF